MNQVPILIRPAFLNINSHSRSKSMCSLTSIENANISGAVSEELTTFLGKQDVYSGELAKVASSSVTTWKG